MKTLKFGMLALFLIVSNLVSAQQGAKGGGTPKTAEERATEHSKKITQQLGLTADQEKSAYTFCLQRAQQMDADRAKFQGDREAMRNARKQCNQTFETNLATILTADQKTKWTQIKEQEKEKRQQGGGQKGGEE